MKKIIALASLGLLALCASSALAADGAELYKANCMSCHAADGSKGGLKGQKSDAILKKLQGYADGTYGGEKKKIMENVVKKQTPDQLKALADYIGTL